MSDESFSGKCPTCAQAFNGWISVADRLPDPYEEVLIFPRHIWMSNECYEGEVNVDGNWITNYEDNYQWHEPVIEVTHWMPIPKDPE